MAETKYAVVKGLSCNDPSKLKKMSLTEARIEACRLAKKYLNSHTRIGIFKEDKNHISGGRYMPKCIEDVRYVNDGIGRNGFYLLQWEKNRNYRVSPTSGRLMDYSREWKYL